MHTYIAIASIMLIINFVPYKILVYHLQQWHRKLFQAVQNWGPEHSCVIRINFYEENSFQFLSTDSVNKNFTDAVMGPATMPSLLSPIYIYIISYVRNNIRSYWA